MTEMKKGNLLWKANTAPLGEDNPLPNKDVNSDSALAKLEQVRVLLSGVATEAKLEQARVLLAPIADVDFATETTLEEVGGSLAALGDKDFATQTTLAALLADIALMKADLAAMKTAQTDGSAKVGLSGTIASDSGLFENRPLATEVREGFIYYAIDLEENRLSYTKNGEWVVRT